MVFGYARVSTAEQNLDLQIGWLSKRKALHTKETFIRIKGFPVLRKERKS